MTILIFPGQNQYVKKTEKNEEKNNKTQLPDLDLKYAINTHIQISL